MKNLLKHVTSPELTVSAVFEHLYSSFTMEEDSSVVERMKPGEYALYVQWINANPVIRVSLLLGYGV